MRDVAGTPLAFDWIVKAEGMAERTCKVEVLYNFPMTMTFDNDNLNGVAWDAAGNPLFLTECQVKVTAADGTTGYGHIERSNRKNNLTNTDLAR
jgi:hypothetical protein